MKKKQYVRPMSAVYACSTESALMVGSGTGTIPVGGEGNKEWYSMRNDFDRPVVGDVFDTEETDGRIIDSGTWE